MKMVTAVGVLVLVACVCQQINSAEYRGRTDDCTRESEDKQKTCQRFMCDPKSGYYTIQTCIKGTIVCQIGQVAEPGEVDLKESYPKCCPQPYCRYV